MNVARLAGIPDSIVQKAESVAKSFEDEQKTKEQKTSGYFILFSIQRGSMTLEESYGMEQLLSVLEKLKVGNIDQQDLMMVKALWKSFQQ